MARRNCKVRWVDEGAVLRLIDNASWTRGFIYHDTKWNAVGILGCGNHPGPPSEFRGAKGKCKVWLVSKLAEAFPDYGYEEVAGG